MTTTTMMMVSMIGFRAINELAEEEVPQSGKSGVLPSLTTAKPTRCTGFTGYDYKV